MKTLLIPIDFSDTSENVLQYAAGFCEDACIDRIVLLKSYHISLFAQLLPSSDFLPLNDNEIAEEKMKMETSLKKIGEKLFEIGRGKFNVETGISELPLLRAIHKSITLEKPDLLLVGSDNHFSRESSPLGEQVISIAKTSPVPVLIIPYGTHYQSIKKGLVPCDFTAVSRLTLLKKLQTPIQSLHPELIVLNVDVKQEYLMHEQEHTNVLSELLETYAYKVYYSQDKNKVRGILDSARKYKVQLIIALPGRYSFFYNLTHRSITDALALNASLPVLILK